LLTVLAVPEPALTVDVEVLLFRAEWAGAPTLGIGLVGEVRAVPFVGQEHTFEVTAHRVTSTSFDNPSQASHQDV
jgi:hypothetical protein